MNAVLNSNTALEGPCVVTSVNPEQSTATCNIQVTAPLIGTLAEMQAIATGKVRSIRAVVQADGTIRMVPPTEKP